MTTVIEKLPTIQSIYFFCRDIYRITLVNCVDLFGKYRQNREGSDDDPESNDRGGSAHSAHLRLEYPNELTMCGV